MMKKKMEWFSCCKDIFRLLACLGLIVIPLSFFSCAASPEVQKPAAGRPADGKPVVSQTKENKLGPLQIFYVDTVTMTFKEGEIQVIRYPDNALAGLEIPFDADNTYKQLWDDEALEAIADAVSRFGVAERSSAFGTADTRSFTTYGAIEGATEWLSQANRDPLSVEVNIDMGYVVKDRKTYFLITQRDTPVAEDNPGLRTARITFCMTMDQIRVMMGMLGIRLYEKPLMVFLGDGVTAGTNATVMGEDDPASAYPAILQGMVTLNILNAGVGWSPSSNALERVEGILKYDPDIVVINVGLIDFSEKIDPSETAKNLQAIIDALKVSDRKIFLTRFYDEFILRNFMDYWEMPDREQTNLINVYDGMFRTLSRVNNVDLITGIWDGLQPNDTISDDGLHPTKEGHKIMAGNFYNSLKAYLGAQNFLK